MTLHDIRKQLEGFQVVSCDLRHEKVALDTATGKPVKTQNSTGDLYKRQEFCALGIRNKRLGCAHSNANEDFKQVVDNFWMKFQEFVAKTN